MSLKAALTSRESEHFVVRAPLLDERSWRWAKRQSCGFAAEVVTEYQSPLIIGYDDRIGWLRLQQRNGLGHQLLLSISRAYKRSGRRREEIADYEERYEQQDLDPPQSEIFEPYEVNPNRDPGNREDY